VVDDRDGAGYVVTTFVVSDAIVTTNVVTIYSAYAMELTTR